MSQLSPSVPPMDNAPGNKPDELFGHPKGLYVLFFTELWERFSFYTMRGILTLYTAAVVLAAMGKDKAGGQADSIYGAYLGFVYSSTFIGGMLADRLLGQRRAIYIGGTLMAMAQFTLAAHSLLVKNGQPVESINWLFFTGLGLLSAGNGFFKPNISTIVGTLYKQGEARRDAAFTIFYMGINIGAFLASFSAGFAEHTGWHWGFLMAGVGMIIGQLIFTFGLKWIGDKGLPPANANLMKGPAGIPSGALVLLGIAAFVPLAAWLISMPSEVQDLALWITGPVIIYLLWEAARSIDGGIARGGSLGGIALATGLAETLAFSIYSYHEKMGITQSIWMIPGAIAAAGILFLIAKAARTQDGGRMIVILVLCTFSMIFWGFFELAGSTITRFTESAVDRVVMGKEVPASFLANVVNPLLIIVLSIPVAGVWVWLDRKRIEPSSPIKFVLGLSQLALAFLMLYMGAKQAMSTGKSPMIWLLLAFLLQTTGELCLSPVGLSTITKLSPTRLVGMFMGFWFLASSLGNVLAPKVADVQNLGFDAVFIRIVYILAGGAAVLLVLALPLKKMMHGVK